MTLRVDVSIPGVRGARPCAPGLVSSAGRARSFRRPFRPPADVASPLAVHQGFSRPFRDPRARNACAITLLMIPLGAKAPLDLGADGAQPDVCHEAPAHLDDWRGQGDGDARPGAVQGPTHLSRREHANSAVRLGFRGCVRALSGWNRRPGGGRGRLECMFDHTTLQRARELKPLKTVDQVWGPRASNAKWPGTRLQLRRDGCASLDRPANGCSQVFGTGATP